MCKDVGLCSSALVKQTFLKLVAPIAKMTVKQSPLKKLVAPISKMVVKQTPLKKLVPAKSQKSSNGLGCTICTLLVGFAGRGVC